MDFEKIRQLETMLVDYEQSLQAALQTRDRLRLDNGFNPLMPRPTSPEANAARDAMAILEKDIHRQQAAINEQGLYAVTANIAMDLDRPEFSVATPIAEPSMHGTYYRRLRLANLGSLVFAQDELEVALDLAMAMNFGVFARKDMARERQHRH